MNEDEAAMQQMSVLESRRWRYGERRSICTAGNDYLRWDAGLPVGLEIKTGKRLVIEYFQSPLAQRGNESLRGQ